MGMATILQVFAQFSFVLREQGIRLLFVVCCSTLFARKNIVGILDLDESLFRLHSRVRGARTTIKQRLFYLGVARVLVWVPNEHLQLRQGKD